MLSENNNQIIINFIYNMLYQVSLVVLPLVTSPYLARVIGPQGLGEYTYSYSIAYLFYILGLLGINNYGNRSIAAVRGDVYKLNYTFCKIYYFQLITTSITTLLYIIYCIYFYNGYLNVAVAQIFFVLSSVLSVNWFFFGLEKFKVIIIRKILIKIIVTAMIFLFVKSINDLLLYSIILSIAELAGELYLWWYIPKYINFCKISIKEVLCSSYEIVLLFIPLIATSVYRYMDKIMIGHYDSIINVGQYDYAEKIIMVCLGCMTALGSVMLPRMSNLIANKQKADVQRYLFNSMNFAMFIGFGLFFGLFAIGDKLALVYFGEKYAICGMLIRYLAITVIPIAWANVIRNQYLIPSSKDKEYVFSVVSGAIINFTLNFFMIPCIGLVGAVLGTIITEFGVAFIQTMQVRRKLDIIRFIKISFRYMIFGFIMFFIVEVAGLFIKNDIYGLLLQVLLGVVVYVIINLLYCYYNKNDLKLQ